MVTAGVFMIARMSPLFEHCVIALQVVLVIGATTALFTGLIAIVQTDIKRVIAYSTLSQLGYMVTALGASAYAAGMFHLITHAFFKALLFLAAGSVILALHHEQDIRKMGNLRKHMPITYICFLIGALALAAVPPLSGFFSKDAIIEATHLATLPGAHYAYICVLMGSFVTAFYIFRVFFLVFHTNDRMDAEVREHVHESPWVIGLPLILLAIPSLLAGLWLAGKMFSQQGLLGSSTVLASPVMQALTASYQQGTLALILESFTHAPFWFALAGIIMAWLCYIQFPQWPNIFAKRFALVYRILVHKFGFDHFNQIVFVRGTMALAKCFYHVGDEKILDHDLVNGSGRFIAWMSRLVRRLQSGFLYHYVLVMIIGLLLLLIWLLG
jgi:NADH-quinone oxidoreductase subunit L